MITLTEALSALRRNQLGLKFGLEREVRHLMELTAKRAREMLGTQQPGWPDLAESTIADKVAQGYDTPSPLRRTGELQESIAAETETEAHGVQGIIGSDDPTALWHELGTSRMPARPFLGPSLMQTEPEIAAALGELAVRSLTPGSRP